VNHHVVEQGEGTSVHMVGLFVIAAVPPTVQCSGQN
jgi:hypothetical protein